MDVHSAAVDVSADQVVVHGFKIAGRKHAARQDLVAESGSKAFQLILNSFQHTDLRSVRNVAIGPGGVLSSRRS